MKKLNRAEIEERLYRSIAIDSSLEVPCPEGLEYRPFQKAGVEYMLTSPYKRHLLGDPMGLGKTIQAIGYVNLREFDKIAVVCPASLCLNWKEELETWLVDDTLTIQVIRSSKDKINLDADIFIVSYTLATNPTILKALCYGRERNQLLIVDESHYIKNPKAKRTKALLGDGGLMRAYEETIFISGTQMLNRPIELYPILNFAAPVAIGYRSWFQYAQDFCGAWHDGYGWNVDGASNTKELGQRLRAYFMVRRKKEKVLTQLPGKDAKIVFIDPDAKAKKVVAKMAKFDAKELSSGKISAGFDGLSEARRELGELMAPKAVQYIKTKIEGGVGKVIVFAHHKEVIRILEEGLEEYGVVSIKGSTPIDKRQEAVKQFQNDPDTGVFVGSITAAGVGITLTAASYVCFVEASWVPGENQQAFDRAHRIGQENFVLGEFLAFPGSLHEQILRTHIQKNKVIKEVMS